MLDPNEAPEGYKAVAFGGADDCRGCAFWGNSPLCGASNCTSESRADGCSVFFVKRSAEKFKTVVRKSVRVELTADQLSQIVLKHLGLTDKNATVRYLTGQGLINATVRYDTEEVTDGI